MSLEINSVVIGGNLTRDVALKDTATGRKVCAFAVACNRTFVINGQKNTETSYLDVEVWGTLAENCGRYLKKGSPVVVVGRLKQDRWENENKEKRSKLKIVATNVQFLPGGRKDAAGAGPEDFPDGSAWDA
jgi:single-strand DNA-binding protein